MPTPISHSVLSDLTVDGHFDPTELVRLLLAFDQVKLPDAAIVPKLIRVFGLDGFMECLDKRVIAFLAVGTNAMAKCDYTSPGMMPPRLLNEPLKFFSEVVYVDNNQPENKSFVERIRYHIEEDKTPVSEAELEKVISEISKSAIDYNPALLSYENEFRSDLFRSNFDLEDLLKSLLATKTGLDFSSKSFKLKIYEENKNIYKIDTNIFQKIGVTKEMFHDIVKESFFEIPLTYLQLKRLELAKASVGFNEMQSFVLGKRNDFLTSLLLEDDVRSDLATVLEISGVPSIVGATKIDASKLIALLESDRSKIFKGYLRDGHAKDLKEVDRVVSDWKRKAGEMFGSTSGKSMRFIVSTAIGFLGNAPGIASAAFDLLLEKVIPTMGPLGFIYGDYKKFANMHVNRIGLGE
jgi:hypothetical protein